MNDTLLTAHQGACRAAQEQVQMLRHLYDRLLGDDGHAERVRNGLARRVEELSRDEDMLSRKLEGLGLLRTEPDPEREGLLEALAELKRAFGAGDERAAGERLIAEENELLRFSETLAEHDEDPAVTDSVARTRAAIRRLESAGGAG